MANNKIKKIQIGATIVPVIPSTVTDSTATYTAACPTLTANTNIEVQANKATVVNVNSTDDQYPSAKAVYDAIPTLSGDAAVANVRKGKTFYNSSYTKQTGTMPDTAMTVSDTALAVTPSPTASVTGNVSLTAASSQPSSGYYIKANGGNVATNGESSKAYTGTGYIAASTTTITSNAVANSTNIYYTVKSGSHSSAVGAMSLGTGSGGGLTKTDTSVSAGSYQITPSVGGTGVNATSQASFGMTTTKPSGTDGTNYITFDPDASVAGSGTFSTSATVTRAKYTQTVSQANGVCTITEGYVAGGTAAIAGASAVTASLDSGSVTVTGSGSVGETVNGGTNWYVNVSTTSATATAGTASASATVTKAASAAATLTLTGMASTTTNTGFYFTASAAGGSGIATAAATATGGSAAATVTKGVTIATNASKSGGGANDSATTTESTASASTVAYIAKASTSATATAGTASATASVTKAASAAATLALTGMASTTTNTGYYFTASAAGGSGIATASATATGGSAAATVTAGYTTGTNLSKSGDSANKSATTTESTASASTVTYVAKVGYSNVTVSTDSTAIPLVTTEGYAKTNKISGISIDSGEILSTVTMNLTSGSSTLPRIGTIQADAGFVIDHVKTDLAQDGIGLITEVDAGGALAIGANAGSLTNYVSGSVAVASASTVTVEGTTNAYITAINNSGSQAVAYNYAGATFTLANTAGTAILSNSATASVTNSKVMTVTNSGTNASLTVTNSKSATITNNSGAILIINGGTGKGGGAEVDYKTVKVSRGNSTTASAKQVTSTSGFLTEGSATTAGATTKSTSAGVSVTSAPTVTVSGAATGMATVTSSDYYVTVSGSGQDGVAKGTATATVSAITLTKTEGWIDGGMATVMSEYDGTGSATCSITPSISGSGTKVYIKAATSGKTDATTSATANAGTASATASITKAASAAATLSVTGMATTTTNTGYYFTASASGGSGIATAAATATGGSARASITASSVSVSTGYLGTAVSVSTSASDTGTKTGDPANDSATTTESTASASTVTYIQAGVLGQSHWKTSAGSAAVSTSMTTASSGYPITLTTGSGYSYANAGVATEGYVKSGSTTVPSSTVEVNVTGATTIYVAESTYTNNTSGGTSLATVPHGKQLKITKGYYESDRYFTAKALSLTSNMTTSYTIGQTLSASSSYDGLSAAGISSGAAIRIPPAASLSEVWVYTNNSNVSYINTLNVEAENTDGNLAASAFINQVNLIGDTCNGSDYQAGIGYLGIDNNAEIQEIEFLNNGGASGGATLPPVIGEPNSSNANSTLGIYGNPDGEVHFPAMFTTQGASTGGNGKSFRGTVYVNGGTSATAAGGYVNAIYNGTYSYISTITNAAHGEVGTIINGGYISSLTNSFGATVNTITNRGYLMTMTNTMTNNTNGGYISSLTNGFGATVNTITNKGYLMTMTNNATVAAVINSSTGYLSYVGNVGTLTSILNQSTGKITKITDYGGIGTIAVTADTNTLQGGISTLTLTGAIDDSGATLANAGVDNLFVGTAAYIGTATFTSASTFSAAASYINNLYMGSNSYINTATFSYAKINNLYLGTGSTISTATLYYASISSLYLDNSKVISATFTNNSGASVTFNSSSATITINRPIANTSTYYPGCGYGNIIVRNQLGKSGLVLNNGNTTGAYIVTTASLPLTNNTNAIYDYIGMFTGTKSAISYAISYGGALNTGTLPTTLADTSWTPLTVHKTIIADGVSGYGNKLVSFLQNTTASTVTVLIAAAASTLTTVAGARVALGASQASVTFSAEPYRCYMVKCLRNINPPSTKIPTVMQIVISKIPLDLD